MMFKKEILQKVGIGVGVVTSGIAISAVTSIIVTKKANKMIKEEIEATNKNVVAVRDTAKKKIKELEDSVTEFSVSFNDCMDLTNKRIDKLNETVPDVLKKLSEKIEQNSSNIESLVEIINQQAEGQAELTKLVKENFVKEDSKKNATEEIAITMDMNAEVEENDAKNVSQANKKQKK